MDHIRIDEGIQRGAKYPHAPPPQPRQYQITGKLADLTPDAVLDRLLSDETISSIAEQYGVHRVRLNQWLITHCEGEWQKVQVARALTAYEDAKEWLGQARDALSLARAREQVRTSQWELERLFSRLYGQKQEVTMTHTIPSDVRAELQALRDELGVRRTNVIDVVPQQVEGSASD